MKMLLRFLYKNVLFVKKSIKCFSVFLRTLHSFSIIITIGKCSASCFATFDDSKTLNQSMILKIITPFLFWHPILFYNFFAKHC